MKTAIVYYRVSTDQQGKSGLSLEAQQEAVRLFAYQEGYQVAPHYIEIEKKKTNARNYWPHSTNAGRRKPPLLLPSSTDWAVMLPSLQTLWKAGCSLRPWTIPKLTN